MKNKKTFKEAFGRNPWDPWSAKAGLDETSEAQLQKYLMSRGINPQYVTKDVKIAHSKSNQFKQWAATHREEVQNEDHVAIAMGKQLDDEGSMVLNQLDILDDAIAKLREVVKDPNMQIPAWVQSKITLAADYMDTVGHYMSSKNEDGMNEEVVLEDTFEIGQSRGHSGRMSYNTVEAANAKEAIAKKQKQGHIISHVFNQDKNTFHHPETGKKMKNQFEEETQQIDELKTSTLLRYATKANKSLIGGDRNKEDKRIQGIQKANYKIQSRYKVKEEVELEEGSVQDTLHQRQQALRKKSGLPHPDYYKELGKSYDIEDDKERLAKQSEIKKKYNVESVLYDNPKGTLTRVTERKKELTRSARIIKSLYKKKGIKEDTYDWEKDDKDTSSYGKQPKFAKSDDKASKVKKESDAAAVLSGGTTLTKQNRDIVELDPRMKVRPNKDAQDADDDNKSQ